MVNFAAFKPNPRVVAFDPGKTTGIATWDENFRPTGAFKVNDEELNDLFPELAAGADTWVIEEYRVYGSVNHTGSKVETIQVIGNIKGYAKRHGIKTVEIRADLKGIAAKWAQVKVPKGHMPDDMAAYLIGYYYLRNNNLIKSKLLEKK